MDYNNTDARNKRKHITLTIQEKLEVINLVESRVSRQIIANRFGIGKSTVHDIHKRKDIIKSFALQNSTELAKRRRVDTKDIKVDSEDDYNRIVEEETIIENFDHEEFDYTEEEGYEIDSSNEIITKSHIELPNSKITQPNNAKRKSKTLTLKEKWDILVQLDEGQSVSAIINKYGIGRTTLYDLKKQRQKIFDYIENSSGETRRTFKKSNYPEIENNLLSWCNSCDYFTEQQFFEKYKQLFVQLKVQNSTIHQSQFSGSWSWCKRFFERNPEYKKKLIKSRNFINSGKSEKTRIKLESNKLNDTDNSSSNILMLCDNAQSCDDLNVKRQSSSKVNINNYEIAKNQINPEIEKELIDWCLKQKIFPNYSSIADRAYNIFVTMDLKGDFDPSNSWAKNFIETHVELYRRYNEEHKISDSDLNSTGTSEYESNTKENVEEESLEFVEPDFLGTETKLAKIESDDYGNEYIIEELDELETSVEEYEEEPKITRRKTEEDDIVSNEEAMNSLKVLIKYSEQRGHDEISSLLIEYQNILLEEEKFL